MTFFEYLGYLTFFLIVYGLIFGIIVPKIKEILRRQCKIRFLCKHEYVDIFNYDLHTCVDYDLKCRKCGKRKHMTIWRNDE